MTGWLTILGRTLVGRLLICAGHWYWSALVTWGAALVATAWRPEPSAPEEWVRSEVDRGLIELDEYLRRLDR